MRMTRSTKTGRVNYDNNPDPCVTHNSPLYHRRVRILSQLDQSVSSSASVSDVKAFKLRKELLVDLSMLVTATDTAATTSAGAGQAVGGGGRKVDERKGPDLMTGKSSHDAKDLSRVADSSASAKSFSMRALECRVGSIHDFVAVLTSPGKKNAETEWDGSGLGGMEWDGWEGNAHTSMR